MNWLAHIVLAGPDPADQIGGVAADLVSAAETRALPEPLRRGIALHHAIDGFTDRHPAVIASGRRLYGAGIGLPAAAAGIAVDMLYDHLLARRWPRDAPAEGALTLEAFAARFYRLTEGEWGVCLPARARRVLEQMAAGDWLASYQDLANVRLALEGIRGRLSPRAAAACPLPRAADVFAAHPGEFEADFEVFWPQLAAHAAQMRVGLGQVDP